MQARRAMPAWRVILAAIRFRPRLWFIDLVNATEQAHGPIGLFASNAGFMGQAYFVPYCASKGAVVNMTRALAMEFVKQPVRINAIAPGAILWPEREIDEVTQQRIVSRTFLKRQGTPQDIARAALFLIRDADYTSGQVITVDGGRSLNS